MTTSILRAWSDDDVAVMAHCVSVGMPVDGAADILGISIREYQDALGVFEIRRRPPTPGCRPCLMCDVQFASPDVTAIKVCDLCKLTDEWRFCNATVRG